MFPFLEPALSVVDDGHCHDVTAESVTRGLTKAVGVSGKMSVPLILQDFL